MLKSSVKYRAIISSDWNECLAPCGPFDFLSYNYPDLTRDLEAIFRQYTGNEISLGSAIGLIEALIPEPVNREQMDAYLDHAFATYKGVPELIEWCLGKDILFMINTTGVVGYFQRVLAKGFLQQVPVLSAHPMIHFPEQGTDPSRIYNLLEISDKAKHTEAVAGYFNIPYSRILLVGDSGGDGPHFKWGSESGIRLIGSMTKPSLETYCSQEGISVDFRFGPSQGPEKTVGAKQEISLDFMSLTPIIQSFLAL